MASHLPTSAESLGGDSVEDGDRASHKTGVSRRGFLGGVAASLAAGMATGFGAGAAVAVPREGEDSARVAENIRSAVERARPHQPTVSTPRLSRATLVAFDLTGRPTRESVGRMLQVVSDDTTRLMAGKPTLTDTASYTVDPTVPVVISWGLGQGFLSKVGLAAQAPPGFGAVPLAGDQSFSDGDILLHVESDSALLVSHAVRQITRTMEPFAAVRWTQQGFVDSGPDSSRTGRNLFGQIDGTVNPRSIQEFDDQVWMSDGPRWSRGGTQIVVRRIEMNLPTWDSISEVEKEKSMGRRLSDGAPLTGRVESDPMDLDATDATGRLTIPLNAHARRASSQGTVEKFLRRPFNYDDVAPGGASSQGLIFLAYTTNIAQRFSPVLARLTAIDALNKWTTPVGSATFVIPPTWPAGGYLAQTLIEG